jgi:hypothetical protein
MRAWKRSEFWKSSYNPARAREPLGEPFVWLLAAAFVGPLDAFVCRASSATSVSDSWTVSISDRSAFSSRFVVPVSRKKLPVR